MGALKGSVAVRRYVVVDPLPRDAGKRLLNGLRAHAFAPIDVNASGPDADADKSVGWVSLHDEEDADLTAEKVFADGPTGLELRVALRTDVLKPPAAEVRRQASVRAAEVEAGEGRALSKRERRALKEEVARALRKRTFPRSKTVDVVWRVDPAGGGRVWLWSQAKGTNEAFVELFTKSFGVRLEVEGAARWAAQTLGADEARALEPTPELWRGFQGVRPLDRFGDEEEAE